VTQTCGRAGVHASRARNCTAHIGCGVGYICNHMRSEGDKCGNKSGAEGATREKGDGSKRHGCAGCVGEVGD
jgi:hypothetical protein